MWFNEIPLIWDELTDLFLSNLNAFVIIQSRHKRNLKSTSKYGFSPDLGEKNCASYPGLSFRPPGFKWGGKKGEFRDWTRMDSTRR